jgi:hypothetical protein
MQPVGPSCSSCWGLCRKYSNSKPLRVALRLPQSVPNFCIKKRKSRISRPANQSPGGPRSRGSGGTGVRSGPCSVWRTRAGDVYWIRVNDINLWLSIVNRRTKSLIYQLNTRDNVNNDLVSGAPRPAAHPQLSKWHRATTLRRNDEE